MDIVNHHTKADLYRPEVSHKPTLNSGRSKTSLRMNYEAQVKVIRNQIGDLETIRLKLGLSARKMCQLLLVDPSAWTRWKKGEDIPPHVWRSLQWYMVIQEKIPGLTSQYFIGKDNIKLEQSLLAKIETIDSVQRASESRNLELKAKLEKLEKSAKLNRIFAIWLAGGYALLFILFYKLIR